MEYEEEAGREAARRRLGARLQARRAERKKESPCDEREKEKKLSALQQAGYLKIEHCFDPNLVENCAAATLSLVSEGESESILLEYIREGDIVNKEKNVADSLNPLVLHVLSLLKNDICGLDTNMAITGVFALIKPSFSSTSCDDSSTISQLNYCSNDKICLELVVNIDDDFDSALPVLLRKKTSLNDPPIKLDLEPSSCVVVHNSWHCSISETSRRVIVFLFKLVEVSHSGSGEILLKRILSNCLPSGFLPSDLPSWTILEDIANVSSSLQRSKDGLKVKDDGAFMEPPHNLIKKCFRVMISPNYFTLQRQDPTGGRVWNAALGVMYFLQHGVHEKNGSLLNLALSRVLKLSDVVTSYKISKLY